MNQSILAKYRSIKASITPEDGIRRVCNVHVGPLDELGESSPGITDLFDGACVPRLSYIFIARDIVDLLAPNCWVSMEFGIC